MNKNHQALGPPSGEDNPHSKDRITKNIPDSGGEESGRPQRGRGGLRKEGRKEYHSGSILTSPLPCWGELAGRGHLGRLFFS